MIVYTDNAHTKCNTHQQMMMNTATAVSRSTPTVAPTTIPAISPAVRSESESSDLPDKEECSHLPVMHVLDIYLGSDLLYIFH